MVVVVIHLVHLHMLCIIILSSVYCNIISDGMETM